MAVKNIEESVVCILVQKILSNTYISLYNVLFCLKHILRLQKFNSIYAAIFPSWYSTIKIQNSFVPFVQFLKIWVYILLNVIKVNPIYWIFEALLALLIKLKYCWPLLARGRPRKIIGKTLIFDSWKNSQHICLSKSRFGWSLTH